MSASQLASTPLDQWHRDAGARMVPFAGYEMPIQYGSIVAEHQACRSSAALFDVSHMGRLRLDGPGSVALLDRLLTRDVREMPIGRVRYSLICNEDGGVLDDVLVYNVETPSQNQFYMLVVNASNREKIIRCIEPLLPEFPDVVVTDRTELTAMIAVQGPKAIEICKPLFSYDPTRLKYYRAVITDQFKKPALVSRTGYTGEDGLELVVRAEEAPRVWENILMAGRKAGFIAAGLGARDTLRMEAAMPLYGHELDETIDPISAGLGFACDTQGREFIGAEAIRKLQISGTKRVRVGLFLEGKRPVREGCPVLDAMGQIVGTVTSGGPSPTLNRPIAMAMVDTQATNAAGLQVDIRGKCVNAIVTPMPFYKRPVS